MPIYAKKLTNEQRKWAEFYEKETGFEPLYQEDLDSNEKSFNDFARDNIRWYEDHTSEIYLNVSIYPLEEE